MAGIYIHIPFCRQACHYCNFHFATSLHYKKELVAALVLEIALQQHYFGGELVETIYLGGGTPSLLNNDELSLIIEQAKLLFNVSTNAEITLEANPDDIAENKLKEWKQIGINRLSIGVQSFFEEDLKWMNRAHNAEQAIRSLQLATQYFNNITIDLIYGSPGLTDAKWKQNVSTALSLGIPHLSCYALTVEEKTPLHKMVEKKVVKNVDADHQSTQFLQLMHWMEEAGYEHYEISNFAKPGWRSRHNSSYWKGEKYLGIGPSAHSFTGKERQWNVANNNIYIQAIQKGEVPFEKEKLTPTQQVNEYIMIALRTMEGINLRVIEEQFCLKHSDFLLKGEKYLANGTAENADSYFRLTKKGKLLADGIAADLFY